MKFYYEANTDIAKNNSNPNGKFKVKGIGYPNLAASIDEELGTNQIRLVRDVGGIEDIQTITLEKGLYNTTELINEINSKIVLAYSGVSDPLTIESAGDNSIKWVNPDTVPWRIDYLGVFNQIINSGVSTETITAGSSSAIYIANPAYGLKALAIVIRNGPTITVPATGMYLDNGIFYLPVQDEISISNSFECHIEADYMTEKNAKRLVCPRKDGILILLIPG
jgi:hypothetical protein